jgi:hypothetical protein
MGLRVIHGRAVLVLLAAVAMIAAQLTVPPWAPRAAPADTTRGSIILHVNRARSVNSGPGFVHRGDAITAYKWLINLGDGGDPGMALNQGTDKCQPGSAGVGVVQGPEPRRHLLVGPRFATPRLRHPSTRRATRASWAQTRR